MEQLNTPRFPVKLQLDSAHDKIKDIESRFLKNTHVLLNSNPNNTNQSGNNIDTGGNAGSITPVPSTKRIDASFSLPDGTNKTIGVYECVELNELYWFVWNENSQHTINIINGFTETCTMAYKGVCLNFSIDPKHAIPEHKVFLQVVYDSKLVNNENIKYVIEKELIFTDALNNVRQLNVLASIGSDFFTTDYFTPVYPHYSTCCDYITLAPIAPNYCPNFELIPRVIGEDGHAVDKELPNQLFENALQIAYNFNYIDNRPSSVSPYSIPVIVGGTDCSEQNPETLPRCAKFTFWAGNAFVNQINIYVRNANTGAWFLYDTIDKHNCPDENVAWWNRTGAWDDFNYDANFNTIEYTFCNNKQCTPVDQNLFTHIENRIPFAATSLTPAGNNLLLANCLVDSDNLTCEQTQSFEIAVTPQDDGICDIPKRKITIYAIIRNDSVGLGGYGNEPEFLFGNVIGGETVSIDGKFYFGGFGMRKHPVTGTVKVAIDGRSGWDSWKDYQQYVPADMADGVGGFVGYLAGTNYVCVSEQVKLANCEVTDLGIIYRQLSTMYDVNGSFDDVVEALYDGEYTILQRFVFEDVPAGRYVFRMAGHRTGLQLGYEKTSTYYDGHEDFGCDTGGDFTPAITKDYEMIINVCGSDYDSLQEGLFAVIKDLTYPDFENDLGNVITYNLVSEFYLFEDEDFTVPFEEQQINFEWGYFTEKQHNERIDIEGFEFNGTPIYLIDPLTVNILGVGIIIPCPPWPGVPYAGQLRTPSGVFETALRKTDHNGFGFYREQFWRWRIFYNVLLCSPFDMTAVFGEPKLGEITVSYIDECGLSDLTFVVGKASVSPPVTILSNKGYKGLKGTAFKSTGTIDKPCNRTIIKGKLVDEDNNPLTGINVIYAGSLPALSDGFGFFELIAHQNTSYTRDDYFIISNTGSSCTIACIDGGNCSMCCDETFQYIALPACVDCELSERDLGTMQFLKINFPDKGLKGRYGIGVVGWDCYGRVVTGAVNVIDYIDTPECWSKHPLIEWFWNGNVLLPDEVKYISFFITKNLNGTMIQWVADSFEMLDKNGNITTSKGQAVAVAVNMESLLQYNEINKFNTLVTYGFVEGDILKIIDDCENPIIYRIQGTTFGTPEETALQSEVTVTNTTGDTATAKTNFANANGSTIIIPFDGQIEALLDKCNIKIEIDRPYKCEDNLKPFFEICGMYPVIDGVPLAGSSCSSSGSVGCDSDSGGAVYDIGGVLNVFDTYKIFRNIPNDGDCANNPSDDPYFSNNITDFWGENVNSFGRVGSENPYVQRHWEEDLVMSSLARINNGVVNGLSTFWDENTFNYDVQNFGGIQAMFAFRNLIGYICTLDFFIAGYKVPYMTVEGNQVIINKLDLGQPNQKTGMNFGCAQENTSSIVYYEGVAYYYSGSEYIMCDFVQGIDISKEGVKGYFIEKAKYISNWNSEQFDSGFYEEYLFEVNCGYDPMRDEVITTMRPRNGLATTLRSHVNENRDVRIEVGETIVYNAALKMWVNFRGYIPEYYGKLRNAKSGRQLYSFVNGLPYSHNNTGGTYCTFYDQKQTPVIELTINDIAPKVKIFMSSSQENLPQNMFIDRIMTDEKNSLSYLNMAWWVRKENIYYAGFWRDMASYYDPNFMQQSTYFEGKRIFGRYAMIRYVNAYINADKYFALSQIWTLFSGSELSMKPNITTQNNPEK